MAIESIKFEGNQLTLTDACLVSCLMCSLYSLLTLGALNDQKNVVPQDKKEKPTVSNSPEVQNASV